MDASIEIALVLVPTTLAPLLRDGMNACATMNWPLMLICFDESLASGSGQPNKSLQIRIPQNLSTTPQGQRPRSARVLTGIQRSRP